VTEDQDCLSYWFPRIEAAGLPVPKTEIIQASEAAVIDLFNVVGDGKPANHDAEPLFAAIAAAGDRLGYPAFLRTGQGSGKHDWQKTCYLQRAEDVPAHVCAIFEWSQIVDFMGLSCNVWVVREMLKTAPAFHAFYGKMPITREFRFFVRNGAIAHRQPYWPSDAIVNPDKENWRELLADMSVLTPSGAAVLTAMTQYVGAVLPGYWSVDWLETVDRGWVLTDMALGDHSFKYDPDAPGEKTNA
jgi:hypothetical protein